MLTTGAGVLWRDVFTFLPWWFSTGLRLQGEAWRGSVEGMGQQLQLSVWTKNLFVPMYGQYDWQSRAISFVVRLFQIVVRGFLLVVWVGLRTAWFFAVVGLPVWLLLSALFLALL